MLDYATKHRDLILKFGRFPHRNAVLGRPRHPKKRPFSRSTAEATRRTRRPAPEGQLPTGESPVRAAGGTSPYSKADTSLMGTTARSIISIRCSCPCKGRRPRGSVFFGPNLLAKRRSRSWWELKQANWANLVWNVGQQEIIVMQTVKFNAGETILSEGEAGDTAFLINCRFGRGEHRRGCQGQERRDLRRRRTYSVR